jgi:DNA-binding MarR family transcriptional regulator
MSADHDPDDGKAEARLGPLDGFLGFHLRLAQEASFRAFAQAVGERGLRPSRFAMMVIIAENPGITQTALGRASGRDKSTLTTAMDDLVKRGLVSRGRDPADRRSYGLGLTAKGRAALARLMRIAEQHDRRLDELVGPANKPLLLQMLRRIIAGLDEGGAERPPRPVATSGRATTLGGSQ